MKKPVRLLKLGGSVITAKNAAYTARTLHIRALARIIRQIKSPLVIAHGAGSYGHTSAAKYGGSHGYTDILGIAKVSQDALEINSIVMKCFIEERLPAVSLRPSSFLVADEGELSEQLFTPIELLLHQGLIPVIYGDVIWDKSWKSTIFSGETSLSHLVHYFLRKGVPVSEVIELTDTAGVLDNDKKTVPEVTHDNFDTVKQLFFSPATVDVTGGMEHKVEEALNLAQKGITTRIIDGNNLKEVASVLLRHGTYGTLIKQ